MQLTEQRPGTAYWEVDLREMAHLLSRTAAPPSDTCDAGASRPVAPRHRDREG
ncbi:hypothetical protein [Umezawaea beigongshangensis]|uniref:hypothetical protein n=1 Tax=Umezawaea beigongshangensis TaxID=2780383 RepID=UPI0018F25E1F|nr:hypothetical protein [Umezawaea beigongshangensis]